MKVRKVKQDCIVFIDEDNVQIILSGSVEVRMHSEESRLFKMAARYKEGDIIGARHLDRGRSTDSESWNVCICEVEIALIPRQVFEELWRQQ